MGEPNCCIPLGRRKKVTVTRTFLMTLTLVTRIIVVMSSTVMRVPRKTGLIWRLRLLRVTVTGLMMRKEEGEKEEVIIPLQGGKRREGTNRGQWRNLLRRSITRVTDTEPPRRSTRAGIVIVTGRGKEVDHPRALKSLIRNPDTRCLAFMSRFFILVPYTTTHVII